MAGVVATFSTLVRAVASLVFVSIVAFFSWVGYSTYSGRQALDLELREKKAELAKQTAIIERLNKDIAAKDKQIEKLDIAVRLLKVDHRLARIEVLDQWTEPGEKIMKTRFQFAEIDGEGNPIEAPRTITIDGDIVYIEGLVVKYLDELVEVGDPLRSTSICLFTGIFHRYQKPEEGVRLDKIGDRPAGYRRGSMSELERKIWDNFWEFANDPNKAKKAGVRAAHGEAPFTKLEKGRTYTVTLRASGGLTIEPGEARPNRETGSL